MAVDLEAAAVAFERNFSDGSEIGASLSIWREGEEVLSLSSGKVSRSTDAENWEESTLTPVYSASKGPAAATTLLAMLQNGISWAREVRSIWPELTAAKNGLTMQELLSHQAGLCALDAAVPVEDRHSVVSALEKQIPHWKPGSGHGYHPRTYGYLLEEIVRRLTGGETLSEQWEKNFARPWGLDFWFGLPEEFDLRVARLHPGQACEKNAEQEFYTALKDPESLTRKSFSSPAGLHAVSDMNKAQNWRHGFAAFGGIGTANALAKFYAMLLHGDSRLRIAKIPHLLRNGFGTEKDKVLLSDTNFSMGCLTNLPGLPSGCFGHPGAGGSLAFADYESDLAFAYSMNQMEKCVISGSKVQRITSALMAPRLN